MSGDLETDTSPASAPDSTPSPQGPVDVPDGSTPDNTLLHWSDAHAEEKYAKHFAKAEDISNYAEFKKTSTTTGQARNSPTKQNPILDKKSVVPPPKLPQLLKA